MTGRIAALLFWFAWLLAFSANRAGAQTPQCLLLVLQGQCPFTSQGVPIPDCDRLPTTLLPVNGVAPIGYDEFTAGGKCGKESGLFGSPCGKPLAKDYCVGHGCDEPPDCPPGGCGPIEGIRISPGGLLLEQSSRGLQSEQTSRAVRLEQAIQPVEPRRSANPRGTVWTGTSDSKRPARPILSTALADFESYTLRAAVQILLADDSGGTSGTGTIEVWQQGEHYRWKAETGLGGSAVDNLDVAFGPLGYQAVQAGVLQVAESDLRQVGSPLPNPLYLMLMPFANEHPCLHPDAMTICTVPELRRMGTKGLERAVPRPTPQSEGQPVVEWFEFRDQSGEGSSQPISAVRLADFRPVGDLLIPHLIHFWEYDVDDTRPFDRSNWRAWVTINIEEFSLNETLPPQAFVTAPPPGLPIIDAEKGVVVSPGDRW